MRVSVGFKLIDGVERNKKLPNSFILPSDSEKKEIKVGDFVKLGFYLSENVGINLEHLWLKVINVKGDGTYVGKLDKTPDLVSMYIERGDTLVFRNDEVLDIKK